MLQFTSQLQYVIAIILHVLVINEVCHITRLLVKYSQ